MGWHEFGEAATLLAGLTFAWGLRTMLRLAIGIGGLLVVMAIIALILTGATFGTSTLLALVSFTGLWLGGAVSGALAGLILRKVTGLPRDGAVWRVTRGL